MIDADADADVIVVGAGPSGLMLAGELGLAGVDTLVLERRPRLQETPKAYGINGQILQLLRYRGLLEQMEAAIGRPCRPAPTAPFGGVDLSLPAVADSPLHALPLPQPQLERLLADHARALGIDIRRGHDVDTIRQEGDVVIADVVGPTGPYRATAHFLVGCDGSHSRVRELAGIPFPGTTYPEVIRLGQVAMPESVSRLDNGDLDVPALGRVRAGFTQTARGAIAIGSRHSGDLLIQTTEDESAVVDEDRPMTLTELQNSICRVLGADFPLGKPKRLSRYRFAARQAERYRDGRIFLAGDAAHQLPATGPGLNVGMLDAVNLAWKLAAAIQGRSPTGLLETYHTERHAAGARALLQTQAQVALRRGHDPAADALRRVFSELLGDEQPQRRMAALIAGTDIHYPPPDPGPEALTGTFAPNLVLRTRHGPATVAEVMRPARPVLLDLADRDDLRGTICASQDRIDIHTAETDHRVADALLIRPDAYIAWAATIDEPVDTAALRLREAVSTWFEPATPPEPSTAGAATGGSP